MLVTQINRSLNLIEYFFFSCFNKINVSRCTYAFLMSCYFFSNNKRAVLISTTIIFIFQLLNYTFNYLTTIKTLLKHFQLPNNQLPNNQLPADRSCPRTSRRSWATTTRPCSTGSSRTCPPSTAPSTPPSPRRPTPRPGEPPRTYSRGSATWRPPCWAAATTTRCWGARTGTAWCATTTWNSRTAGFCLLLFWLLTFSLLLVL